MLHFNNMLLFSNTKLGSGAVYMSSFGSVKPRKLLHDILNGKWMHYNLLWGKHVAKNKITFPVVYGNIFILFFTAQHDVVVSSLDDSDSPGSFFTGK